LSNPAIVAVAYNRPASLRRLLGSLQAAEYPCSVELVISIDGEGGDEVVRVAEDFKWHAGKKEILQRPHRMGLREHILACGDLSERYGTVIVLEDDLYVSPVFYHFALQASSFYASRPEIAGIALYAHRVIRSNHVLFEPMVDQTDVIFLQYACSWGQLWTFQQWSAFRKWYCENADRDDTDCVMPDYIPSWPETSWLKYYMKYLVSTDRYFVYPRDALTTCFQEAGQHYTRATNNCQVALQRFKRDFRLQHFDQSCCVYDARQTILPDRVSRLVPELAQYDYAIDFYGIKSLSGISSPYMLTCRRSNRAILEFACNMRPVEMNVIENVQGKGIVLTRTTDIEPVFRAGPELARTYPELGLRNLLPMLGLAAQAKIRDRLQWLRCSRR